MKFFICLLVVIGLANAEVNSPNLEAILRRVEGVEASNDALRQDNVRLGHQVQQLEKQIGARKRLDYMVSFTAYPEQDTTYSENELIVFGGELVDYGALYDTTSGNFTCPVDAYYLFSVTLYSSGTRAGAEILVNNVPVASAYNGESYTQSTASVVHFCEASAKVSLRSTNDNSDIWGSTTNYYYSTFSGTLLFEELS